VRGKDPWTGKAEASDRAALLIEGGVDGQHHVKQAVDTLHMGSQYNNINTPIDSYTNRLI
jgi:hypothetical protein